MAATFNRRKRRQIFHARNRYITVLRGGLFRGRRCRFRTGCRRSGCLDGRHVAHVIEQLLRQTFYCGILHRIQVPFEPNLQGMFFFAPIDGQDAVRRNLSGRFRKFEIILVVFFHALGHFVAFG